MAILKPQINGKYSEKCKKTTLYQKPIKRILKPKYKLSGGLHLAGQGSQIALLPSCQLLHYNKHFRMLINAFEASLNQVVHTKTTGSHMALRVRA